MRLQTLRLGRQFDNERFFFFVQTLTRTSIQVHESCQRDEDQNVRPELNEALRHIENPRPIILIPVTKMSREITLVWFGVVRRHRTAH